MTKAKPSKSADAKKEAKTVKKKAADETVTGPKAAKTTVHQEGKKAPAAEAATAASGPAVPDAPRPAAMFSNLGIGIKTSSKKPALSVAPGVMILGRPAQQKPDSSARPSERRLSKKELADITTFLMEKRERLLAGMRRELALQKERAESKAADEVDKATDAYDEDLSFEIATANDQELQDIQIAIEKLEKGTYGECEVCGCGISPSRLKILPSATTCVACRGMEEQARRREDADPLFSMMSEDGEAEGESL